MIAMDVCINYKYKGSLCWEPLIKESFAGFLYTLINPEEKGLLMP